MSLPEAFWRIRCKFTAVADHLALPARQKPVPTRRMVEGHRLDELPQTGVLGHPFAAMDALGETHGFESVGLVNDWRAEAVAAAERIADHRLSFFDLSDQHLGVEINWNYEFKAAKATPMGVSAGIDYRDHATTGDCKFVWEPNRHHHLVTLGRAYRLSGDERFARAAVEQLESWIRQCPYGVGMNWRSPLELGIRLINWVWTLELIRPSPALTGWPMSFGHGGGDDIRSGEPPDDHRLPHLQRRWATSLSGDHLERIVESAYRHLWEISRKYSRFSSANNHLVGEAAGVFIGSSYFSHLRDAPRWRAQSREILLREILAQTHPDGGTREQAFGYHLFVLQLFLLAGLVARNDGDDMTPEYWRRLERMFEFAAAFFEASDSPPLFGDCDDAYVLDLGGSGPQAPARGLPGLMSIGAVLFERSDFAALAGAFHEPAWWLLGDAGRSVFERISTNAGPRIPSRSPRRATGRDPRGGWVRERILAPAVPVQLCSRAFPESGYYLMQRGARGGPRCVSVVFDCGPLGFESIAAHGHADALSFTLRVGGADVLVDPGTYDYFTYNGARDYFRSTRAHNTIMIDETDQSEMLGPFLWGRQAQARCLAWEPSETGGTVSGEHDGYTRLKEPVVHRRTLTMSGQRSKVKGPRSKVQGQRSKVKGQRSKVQGTFDLPTFDLPTLLVVRDEIISEGQHEVCMHLHLGEQCTVEHAPENGLVVNYGPGTVTISLDPKLTVSVIKGRENPILGWVSRGYHHRAPATTIEGRCRCDGKITLCTRLRMDGPKSKVQGRRSKVEGPSLIVRP
ncbi:MAG: alginate lyase family protein [Phycisphaerae bacterium]